MRFVITCKPLPTNLPSVNQQTSVCRICLLVNFRSYKVNPPLRVPHVQRKPLGNAGWLSTLMLPHRQTMRHRICEHLKRTSQANVGWTLGNPLKTIIIHHRCIYIYIELFRRNIFLHDLLEICAKNRSICMIRTHSQTWPSVVEASGFVRTCTELLLSF